MIYLFNHTEFAVSELAHETVKNALLAMRFYCNKLNFPLSMSGRHPDGKGKLVPMHYAVMAMAGTPDGKSEFDKEMASAYLRLVSDTSADGQEPEYMPKVSNAQERKMAKRLVEKGFRAEPDPQEICHWAMAVHPFSVVATGRRWPAVTPAIFGRRNIIWDITFMAVIWRMAVYRF